MAKPIVAIVGRPNVGKSTLVNRIAQKKEAIVHESRGVTRDRSYHEADWCGREFTLVDTGGIETGRSDDAFAGRIREQAEAACQEADVIIFVVDATTGVTEEDETVARILRRAGKPVFLVANKLDNPADDKTMWDFYALGLGEPRPISAVHGHGTGDLLDEVVAALPEPAEEPEYPEDALRVAIIGRPNVGKSSITNRFAGKNRSIVSDVAGTTRDALDVIIERGDKRYRLVDTAGMRKRNLVHEDVEYYSLVRGLRAIDEAEVCLLVVDASEGVTEQDQKIAGLAIERGCALIILLNKWDLVTDDHAREEVMQSVARRMTFAPWAPVIRVSALTGRSLEKVWAVVDRVGAAHSGQVPTSALNNLLAQMRESGHTIVKGPKRLRIQYANQTGNRPPAITFFCNFPELIDDNYKRYLENRLREQFNLEGTPLRLRFRKKQSA
ncbi:MAG: ribosome biogenesis GTPase Der [Parolsenella sp.]|uniref:ribosome biogenesis GTPase Der n=1 Tax=Parolsenella sp. TaxID=2083006 RepID=UPI002E77A890|nr:ribosome biogenesis GTPase Der [Parolsenella sp.]MEE1372081.1 ribosome biogenesis GTPase Der [Parolsenella sp.]